MFCSHEGEETADKFSDVPTTFKKQQRDHVLGSDRGGGEVRGQGGGCCGYREVVGNPITKGIEIPFVSTE